MAETEQGLLVKKTLQRIVGHGTWGIARVRSHKGRERYAYGETTLDAYNEGIRLGSIMDIFRVSAEPLDGKTSAPCDIYIFGSSKILDTKEDPEERTKSIKGLQKRVASLGLNIVRISESS